MKAERKRQELFWWIFASCISCLEFSTAAIPQLFPRSPLGTRVRDGFQADGSDKIVPPPRIGDDVAMTAAVAESATQGANLNLQI